MVSTDEAKDGMIAQGKAAADKKPEPTNLEDRNSNICPGCGGRLDFWACEALCHHCGLKFTCDE